MIFRILAACAALFTVGVHSAAAQNFMSPLDAAKAIATNPAMCIDAGTSPGQCLGAMIANTLTAREATFTLFAYEPENSLKLVFNLQMTIDNDGFCYIVPAASDFKLAVFVSPNSHPTLDSTDTPLQLPPEQVAPVVELMLGAIGKPGDRICDRYEVYQTTAGAITALKSTTFKNGAEDLVAGNLIYYLATDPAQFTLVSQQ